MYGALDACVSMAPALELAFALVPIAFAPVLIGPVQFALQLVAFALVPIALQLVVLAPVLCGLHLVVLAPVPKAPLTVPNTVAVTQAMSIAK